MNFSYFFFFFFLFCYKLKQKNKSRKSNNFNVELNPMAKDFFSNHLNSNSSFFNLCVSLEY